MVGALEALIHGRQADTASRTGIDAWLVDTSARCGPPRGGLHDAVMRLCLCGYLLLLALRFIVST